MSAADTVMAGRVGNVCVDCWLDTPGLRFGGICPSCARARGIAPTSSTIHGLVSVPGEYDGRLMPKADLDAPGRWRCPKHGPLVETSISAQVFCACGSATVRGRGAQTPR